MSFPFLISLAVFSGESFGPIRVDDRKPGALPLPPLKGRVAKETGFPNLPRAKPLVQTG
jgi:hypothetical protein